MICARAASHSGVTIPFVAPRRVNFARSPPAGDAANGPMPRCPTHPDSRRDRKRHYQPQPCLRIGNGRRSFPQGFTRMQQSPRPFKFVYPDCPSRDASRGSGPGVFRMDGPVICQIPTVSRRQGRHHLDQKGTMSLIRNEFLVGAKRLNAQEASARKSYCQQQDSARDLGQKSPRQGICP
jgi:hypothetical protein